MINEFVLEDTDFRKWGLRVLFKVLNDGLVDLNMGIILLFFMVEDVGEVLASYFNSKVVFLKSDGHGLG